MFIWWIIDSNSNWHFTIWPNIEWERSVSMSEQYFFFWSNGAGRRLESFSYLPNYWIKGCLVTFKQFILILDFQLISINEDTLSLSAVFARSFRKWPRGIKRLGTADETSKNAPHKHQIRIKNCLLLLGKGGYSRVAAKFIVKINLAL